MYLEEGFFYNLLGKRMRSIRKSESLSQAMVAQLLNISHQQYQKYESGKNKIPVYRLYRFCNLTGVDVSSLLNLVDSSK